MKRALLKGVLGALVVAGLTMPATAATYGWPASDNDRAWMNNALSTHEMRGVAAADETIKNRRSARQFQDDDPAPRIKRKLPAVNYDDVGTGGQSGVASYYWQPQRVASGGWFDPTAMTAAHKTLPFGTKVRVTHQATGRAVTVTINDRGPYIAGRVIDLSVAAAGELGMKGAGIAKVNLTVLGR